MLVLFRLSQFENAFLPYAYHFVHFFVFPHGAPCFLHTINTWFFIIAIFAHLGQFVRSLCFSFLYVSQFELGLYGNREKFTKLYKNWGSHFNSTFIEKSVDQKSINKKYSNNIVEWKIVRHSLFVWLSYELNLTLDWRVFGRKILHHYFYSHGERCVISYSLFISCTNFFILSITFFFWQTIKSHKTITEFKFAKNLINTNCTASNQNWIECRVLVMAYILCIYKYMKEKW